MAFLAGPSFQEGKGSVCADAALVDQARATTARRTREIR